MLWFFFVCLSITNTWYCIVIEWVMVLSNVYTCCQILFKYFQFCYVFKNFQKSIPLKLSKKTLRFNIKYEFFQVKTNEKTNFYWFSNLKSNWKSSLWNRFINNFLEKNVLVSFETFEVQNLIKIFFFTKTRNTNYIGTSNGVDWYCLNDQGWLESTCVVYTHQCCSSAWSDDFSPSQCCRSASSAPACTPIWRHVSTRDVNGAGHWDIVPALPADWSDLPRPAPWCGAEDLDPWPTLRGPTLPCGDLHCSILSKNCI